MSWYFEVLEKGIDSSKIIKEYALLEREHKELKKTSKEKVNALTKRNLKLTQRIEVAFQSLEK